MQQCCIFYIFEKKTNMNKHAVFYLGLILGLLLVSSCRPEEPEVENEEELITTVIYTLTPTLNPGSSITLIYEDLDGDGEMEAEITGGTLDAAEVYTGVLTLSNEAESPAEDITEEIMEEDAEHQFFFETDVPGLAISYEDEDGNGFPVGLSTRILPTLAGSGNLTIILKHEPEKDAEGVSDGLVANSGGSTDINISIPITVQ